MKHYMGIDIGSTTCSVVVLDESRELIFTDYRFHKGQILDILKEQLSDVDLKNVHNAGYTSSCPDIFLQGIETDSRVAYITATRHFHPDPGALLIIGGEKFGLVRFGKDGTYQNFKSNTSCAAGTGSFLDQQLSRLNLENISRLGELASTNKGSYPKIASRCSVFAKTDLIHAQQEGYKLEQICDGLCYGLAKNVLDAVFDEDPLPMLIVTGGVSLNAGVMKHLKTLTQADLVIQKYSHVYGAIGAALSSMDQTNTDTFKGKQLSDLLRSGTKEKSYHNPPLELHLSSYPDFSEEQEYLFTSSGNENMGKVEVTLYQAPAKEARLDCYLGIDIGSTSTKAVLLTMDKEVVAGFYTRTSGRPVEALQTVLEAIDHMQDEYSCSFLIKGAGTTGSGRKLLGRIINADTEPDEITAHARAAVELDPKTDTIIEIGGQDSKFTLLRNGIVTLSIMNNVCAAGTGSFIEEQANKLNCPLSEYSDRASKAASPMTSDRCTVFMERDLNHYLNEGYEKDELLASVLHSVRENYLTKVTGKAKVGDRIFFQGATAKNKALVAAFEQKLGKPITVSRYCHLTGALGVALELHDKQIQQSTFRGIDLWKKDIPVRSEVCDLCTNHCKLKIAEIEGETAVYGFLCGRDYETQAYVKKEEEGFDLLKHYKKNFRFKAASKDTSLTIGLPYALHMTEELLIWQYFFDQFGIRTITSEKYASAVKDGKKMAEAEFCAPVAAAFGHVHFLADKADYIFLPVYLEKGQHFGTSKLYCFYTQYLSTMLSSTKKFRDTEKILMPLVYSLKSDSNAVAELVKMFQRIGIPASGSREVRSALNKARERYLRSVASWKELYTENRDQHKINIVLLGRPYTVLSEHMNNKIPDIIASKGYNAFYMDMLPEYKPEDPQHAELVRQMSWKYASTILESADQVARTFYLYPILVTSFKCTPDSFVIEYFREIMDAYNKPYLILQLDEHDSAVGYETRIEAAIRSFTNHFDAGFFKAQRPLGYGSLEGFTPGLRSDESREVEEILEEHEIPFDKLKQQYMESGNGFDLSEIKYRQTSKLKGKKILIPGWDLLMGKLIEAMMIAAGYDAAAIIDTPGSIQRSLNMNTGQCLPLTTIAQNAAEYIEEHNLEPENVAVWVPRGYLGCNLPMFAHYTKKLLKKYDESFADVVVYPGNPAYFDFSAKVGVNAYLIYLFSGSIRKVECKLRPYEKVKGATDRVSEQALELLYEAFLKQAPKEPVIRQIMDLFDQVEIQPGSRPKVAIFGDLYARDNDVFNQDLIRVIEANGGEALPTSYSEYLKVILKQTEIRLYQEGRYWEHYNVRILKYTIPLMENKYNKYFEKYIRNIQPATDELFNILEKHHLHLLQRGETVDNIFKIENLIRTYDDIALFVAANPAYCCPSLVTEAMSARIEKMTGIPVVSIEYDGTMGAKNEDIIPYLQLRKRVNGT
ncbi:acyl-CoA dehydratase activase [Bacteroidota bacterium]